jgi:pimeloyl-ACP methyl ester carboxylesterase
VISADYIEIDGRLGYVERCGDGPVVLLLHTAGQSGVQWRDVLRNLPEHGFSALVPDLPGHGRSDPAVRPIEELHEYTLWCTKLLESLDVSHPFVVGCSIGGKLALDLALRLSGGLAPAAVIAMACDAWNRRLSADSLRSWLEDSTSPSRSDRTYYGTLGACGRSVTTERAQWIATMHRREDPRVSAADLIGWAQHDLRERLGEIQCPALLLAGEDDFWVNPSDVDWAARQMPTAAFGLLPGVGHYPMEEISGFSDLLAGWLRALGSGTHPSVVLGEDGSSAYRKAVQG